MPKLLPLLLAMSTCVLASCGNRGGDDSAAQTTTTAVSDSSRAATLPLRTSDLPAGFAAVDTRLAGASPMVSQCIPTLLVANATQLGETFVRDEDSVSSQSYVLPNSDAAREVLTTLADSNAQVCLANLLQTHFDVSRSEAGLRDLPTTAIADGLDPTTAQFRITAIRSSATSTQTAATADLLLMQSDRSVSAVWLTWFDGSPSEATEKSIITALRARATAAFTD